MTTSLLAEPSGAVLLGQRTPRIRSLPPSTDTSGHEAIEAAHDAGLILDGWQCDAVCDLLAERADGRWAARRTYTIVPRQNGKGGIIEAIELYGLFLLHEHILHSAHLFDTARDAFMRVRALIEGTPDLAKRVKRINEAHGKEGIELLHREPVYDENDGTLIDPGGPGGSLRFHARTKGGGRGKSPQRLVLDEGFALTRDQMAALLPAISAQANPQVNVFSTPPPHGEPCEVLMNARREVIEAVKEGRHAGIAWLEWSVERGTDVTQVEAWVSSNPAFGFRDGLNEETCRDELGALGVDDFAVERCGMWPAMGAAQWLVIPQSDWAAAADPCTDRDGVRAAFAIEASPDRAWAAILAAWPRPDGLLQIEVVDLKPGTGWVLPRALDLNERRNPCAWVVARDSPAGSEVPALEEAGIEVVRAAAPDLIAGAGMLFDGVAGVQVDARDVRHAGQQALDDAVAAAVKRPPTDRAWSWDRARPHAYVLIGATAALWGLASHGSAPEPVEPWAMYA